MNPYFDNGVVQLYQADAREIPLPDHSVNCVVTSPPYWGLRDYGLGPSALGMEATPELYVESIVDIFREVRRVLRDDGTLWLNLGDSYAGNRGNTLAKPGFDNKAAGNGASLAIGHKKLVAGLKEKDLVGIPWMVAFALRGDGWWLRSDIIWSKPNPMPESVTDRPTRAHEYLFLLTKSGRYFYDADAIRTPDTSTPHDRSRKDRAKEDQKSFPGAQVNGMRPRTQKMPDGWDTDLGAHGSFHRNGREKGQTTEQEQTEMGANKRSVWEIATQPYPKAHFATFPEALVEPCILAGSPPGGLVLDPFAGTATVCAVAQRFGRRAVGLDLKEEYLDLAVERISAVPLPLGI